MADKKEISFQRKVENSVDKFVNKNKMIIMITGIALVAIFVGLWIGISVSANRAEANMGIIDELDQQYTTWAQLEDVSTTEAVELSTTLKNDLAKFASSNSKSYPSVKASYLLGLVAFKEGDWDTAKNEFLSSLEKGKDSYMAPLSLFNLAVTSEQLNDTNAALDYYQRVYDSTNGSAAQSAKALFNVGRLHEANNDIEIAKAVFQQLKDEYPSSEYAKLAASKLVLL